MKHWYESKTGNHQGLVIEEETGRNVAVTYDKADAPLVAAAPALLEALRTCLAYIDCDSPKYESDNVELKIRNALALAEKGAPS